MQRIIFYIDGFNFYFGIRRARKINSEWGKCYWIDMVKLCESFLGENQCLEFVKAIMPDIVACKGKSYSIPIKWKNFQ